MNIWQIHILLWIACIVVAYVQAVLSLKKNNLNQNLRREHMHWQNGIVNQSLVKLSSHWHLNFSFFYKYDVISTNHFRTKLLGQAVSISECYIKKILYWNLSWTNFNFLAVQISLHLLHSTQQYMKRI